MPHLIRSKMQQLFSWKGHCIENCNLTELYRTSQPFDSVRTTFPAVQDLSLSISAFGKRAHWAKALDLLFTSFQRGVEVNVIVLNSAVSACQRAHQWRFALVLVSEAGIHWKGIDPDIISYNSIVAGVAAKGHWEVALAVLSLAEESTLQLDERSYTNLLQACAPSCWDVSLWILQDMLEDRVEIDAFACAAAVSTCAESKKWELALHFLASVSKCWQTEKRAGNEDRGDWQVPMATAISVCGSVGEWMVALSLLESLQNVSTTPNIVTFGTAMKCLEQSGSWPKVLEIWTWMRNLRVAPNVYTYSMLMSSLESAGMWSRVCSTFSAMKESHVSPTSISYDILLRSCRDHIGWQFAIQILDSMRAVKVQPTVKTLNACLSILEADETQDAWCLSLGMLESMGSMSLRPDIASYSIVANTCVRSGDWQVSLILLDKMSSSLLELDAISLSISLLACEKGSQWPEAFTTLQDMHLKQVELSEISVSSVLRACQSRGCWEEALSILCTASSWRVPLGTGTCNPVLGACCSSQSWERALSLFATASSSGFRPDVVSLTTLMSACEAGFQWESALCLLFSFQDRAVQLDSTACNVGISSCASLLNWRVASALLHCDSLKQSLSASGDWPDLIAYNTVLGSCTQLESWQFALLLFQQLQIFAKLEPDTTTFHAILEACAVGQAWECALSILKDMTGFSFPFGIARNLAASACQAANRIHEARQLLVQNLHETIETAESAADTVTFKAILDLSECGDPALLSQAPGCLEALAFRARGNLVGAEGLNVVPGMLGPAAQAVVAAEILHWHQRLGEELCQQLRLRVGTPAKQQLDRLCQRKPKESSGRLQNHILERQFGLSPALSLKLLSEIFDNSLGCQLWSTSAHLNSRRVLNGMEVSLDEEPTSKNLAAWASWSLVDSGCSRSQCQGYGAAGSDQVLLPVQVQHDRSPHAERQASEVSNDLSLSNKVLFRGVPENSSAEDVSALLQKFGPLECLCYEKGRGNGSAEFLFCGSAESAEEESMRSSLVLAGQPVQVVRGAPRWEGSTDTGAFQQAFVKPIQSSEPLDVVIVRGQSSSAGIGMVAELAKTKTTTLVIWDRHHRPRDEVKVAALKKKTFTEVFSEQEPDKAVMEKAGEFFSVGAPKCALVHMAEEKLKTEAQLQTPLSRVNDLMDSCRHNHLETIGNFNAFKIYKPWVHANRACTFVLIPPKLCYEWDDDLATCTTGSRRIVRSDPLRLPDGSGWTLGLQLTHSAASVNAALASATVTSVVLADDATKHQLAGRCLELSMPVFSSWVKGE